MIKEKIANRQLLFILYMMRTTVVIAFLPVLTSADAAQDAWLAAILAVIGTSLIAFFAAGLGARFPEKTLIQYGEELLGPWLGKIPSLVVLWALLTIAATDTRIYGEMLVTSFLTETPMAFIIGTMAIVSAIGAREGIEVLGRVADTIFPLFLFMLTISLLLPLPEFRAINLEPVLARGLGPVLWATVTPVAVGAQLLVITMLIPSLNAPRLATRTALWATAGAGLTLLATTLITIGVLGPDHGSRSLFPFYAMTRAIEISEYLQRVEAPIIFAWGLGVFVGIAVILNAGARGLAQLLHLADYRPLVFPMAVIQATYALHAYENIFQLLAIFRPGVIGPYGLSWFLLSLVPLWLAYLGRQFSRRLRQGG
ncbi:MAG TPA: endospore germination permease [Firmicutes bacterium]|nr:endospore germination permease [Bacillota bacterium]